MEKKSRKLLLIVMILMATSLSQAQTCDSIDICLNHWDRWWPCTVFELNDDNLMFQVALYNEIWQGEGHCYYKISRQGAEVMDSVFFESEGDWDMHVHMISYLRDPETGRKDFFRARVIDTIKDRTDLVITHFDDDMNFDVENEKTVTLSDTLIWYYEYSFCHDSYGDIIMAYSVPTRHETHFVRIGLDGVLKHENVVPDTVILINWQLGGLRESRRLPLQYQYFGVQSAEYFRGFELDSLFNVVKCYAIDADYELPLTYPYYSFGSGDRMVPCPDDGFLTLSSDSFFMGGTVSGVLMAKHDAEGNLVRCERFASFPWSTGAVPIDLLKSGDGYNYMSYSTGSEGYMSLVKMDDDLNVIWQRFFLPSGEYRRMGAGMKLLEDGSVAVYGSTSEVQTGDGMGVLLYLFNEEGWSMPEMGTPARPYMFYPNPAQDRLHLQYSPDVQPKNIELCDLQGRLVHSQSRGLENVNLQGLTAGQYLMKVTLEDGKVYSDKVIKE